MVEKMVEKDRSLIRIQNEEGLTPVHCTAAEMRKVDHLKILLAHERESSAAYIQDCMGRTPLHIAMLRRNVKALDALIEACPDCTEIVDHRGQNVLHYGAKWAFEGVIQWVKSRALTFDKYINDKDEDGNAPLHIFAASVHRNPDFPFFLRRLDALANNYPYIDLSVFDKQNNTVGDILHSLGTTLDGTEHPIFYNFPRGGRSNIYERDNFDVEKAETNNGGEWDVKSIKKAAESRLIVAALIATVSFTAALTVPGGLDENAGKNMGMPVFKSKTLFKVFLVSNGIAFATSAIAILCYFLLVSTISKSRTRIRATWGLIMNTISLGALMIAFGAAVCAVSPNWMGYVIVTLAALFFIIYVDVLDRVGRVGSFISYQQSLLATRVRQ